MRPSAKATLTGGGSLGALALVAVAGFEYLTVRAEARDADESNQACELQHIRLSDEQQAQIEAMRGHITALEAHITDLRESCR